MTLTLLLAIAAHSGQIFLGGVPLGEAPEPRASIAPLALFGNTALQPSWTPGEHPVLDAAPPARSELIVLTTQELVAGSLVLPLWMDQREAEGWTVELATEDDWDHPVASGPDDRAARIRSWLQEGWADRPGAYLLLVGDPSPDTGDIPMAWVHPLLSISHYFPDDLARDMEPVPTDFLYAELTGSWDQDGDGLLGEYPADQRAVDWGPELYVGRLPIYDGSASDLDQLLLLALERDMEVDKAYRRDVLLPGALFGVAGAPAPGGDSYVDHSDGAAIQDALWWDLPLDFSATRLFERDGILPSTYETDLPLSLDETLAQWSVGRGMVVWSGHGSPTGAYRMIWEEDSNGDGWASYSELSYPPLMESQYHRELIDIPGAFTAHVSCPNGVPEVPQNIGTALLYGGAAGTVTASRVALGATADWGESWVPRPDLATTSTAAYYFAMLMADGWTAGEALAWTKYSLPGDGWGSQANGYGWYTKLQLHLYGDPTRSLELCEVDEDCDDGSPCDGFETCDDGACVHHEPVSCAHLDSPCEVGVCDDDSGACEIVPRPDGAPCDDDLWCTEGDSCLAGECTAEPRDCGQREGYESACVEESQTCEMWPLEEPGGGCSHSRSPAWWWLLAPALLGLRRRASSV